MQLKSYQENPFNSTFPGIGGGKVPPSQSSKDLVEKNLRNNVEKNRKKSICEQSSVKHPIAGGEIPPLQSSEDLVETSFCRECDTGSKISIIRENLPKNVSYGHNPYLPPSSPQFG